MIFNILQFVCRIKDYWTIDTIYIFQSKAIGSILIDRQKTHL